MNDCKNCNCRNPTEKEKSNIEGNYIETAMLEIPEVLYVAICIYNGRYEEGNERINNLKGLGYSDSDITKIQKCVNTISEYYEN